MPVKGLLYGYKPIAIHAYNKSLSGGCALGYMYIWIGVAEKNTQ